MLQNMRIFVQVVESGSYAAAARTLNSTTSYVSRAISRLEQHLGTSILFRTTRQCTLTKTGEVFHKRCLHIIDCIDKAEAEVTESTIQPSGILKISSAMGLGQHHVVPAVSAFQKLYPSVSVELTLSHGIPDLIEGGCDVAIVITDKLPDSGLISRRLASVSSILCASPEYLIKNGTPESLKDLAAHFPLQLVNSSISSNKWNFRIKNGQETVRLKKAAFQVNTVDALSVAIESGMGIGLLPTYSALDGLRRGTMKRILQECESEELFIYALYTSRLYTSEKIKKWITFLSDYLSHSLHLST